MIKVPTPLQQLSHPLLKEKGIDLYVKRDDLTHPEIVGNKWRKLKYNLQEAKGLGCSQLVTMGGAFSNHIAATAAAAKAYGFKSVGIIRGEELNKRSNEILRFAHEKGMIFEFVDRNYYRNMRRNPEKRMNAYKESYFLPEGGTNELAIKGCEEIIPEINVDFDLIVCPIGTGGTFCGLIASLEENQSALGMSVLKGDFILNEVDKQLDRYQIRSPNFDINIDYHFGGYGKITDELIDFINEFKENFSITLDPIYTGKSFFGVWDLIKRDNFEKNLKIVLLHTGGLPDIMSVNRKNQDIFQ
ncbi:MAG: pyridoxal-phosphate dependent enzyme [Bacteroidota bacterium]